MIRNNKDLNFIKNNKNTEQKNSQQLRSKDKEEIKVIFTEKDQKILSNVCKNLSSQEEVKNIIEQYILAKIIKEIFDKKKLKVIKVSYNQLLLDSEIDYDLIKTILWIYIRKHLPAIKKCLEIDLINALQTLMEKYDLKINILFISLYKTNILDMIRELLSSIESEDIIINICHDLERE